MAHVRPPTINGLHFKLMFFDYIYMLGECLSALSELHTKIQLVDRYCSKVLHNLQLFKKQGASEERFTEFIRKENQDLVTGLKQHNIFYDKYRLKLITIRHAGTQGDLLVEDVYNGSQYVVPVKRVVDQLLTHVFDSTTVPDMPLFEAEQAVMQVTSTLDAKAGETAHRVILELNEAARHVHVYVKKEKLVGVDYLISGKPVTDPDLIVQAETQETEKDRFLRDPLIRTLLPHVQETLP